ncbi:putative protein FLX-like 1 [Iris pallida]|uniref:Uncharacterized protein n=1 Tax=Iris pallida TaxID=29817 RepID=A0AAX6FUD0_IRIPA|nr:putative protein FLX-like 1 [Iris pallida]
MRVEDEARAVDGMRMELVQVRSGVSKLGQLRDELLERLKELKDELERVRGEMGRSEEIKEEIEMMRKELERGRLAVEYEKKVHADNLEQSKAMEKTCFPWLERLKICVLNLPTQKKEHEQQLQLLQTQVRDMLKLMEIVRWHMGEIHILMLLVYIR